MAKKNAKRKAKRKPGGTKASFRAIRKMLVEKRNTILDEITHGAREIRAPTRRPDIADMASETAETAVDLEVYRSGSSELAQIEAALRKIDDRTYGTCEFCGEAIPIARVRALPFATACVRCKEKQELVERARGTGVGPAPGDEKGG